MFATSGFQSGAIQYASEKGIATITFMAGKFVYQTRGALPAAASRLPAGLPEYVGVMVAFQNTVFSRKTLDETHSGPFMNGSRRIEEDAPARRVPYRSPFSIYSRPDANFGNSLHSNSSK